MSRRSKAIPQKVEAAEPVPSGRALNRKTAARPRRANASKTSYQISRTNKSIRTAAMVILVLVGVVGIGILVANVVGEYLPWTYSEEISPAQARKQLSSGAIVLDVRLYEDYIAGHIEKSLWMPLEDLTALMNSLPHDRLIIVVCNSGVRSIQARYILQDAGYTQVTSMTGGMQAWVAAGYPVITGEPVRQYN